MEITMINELKRVEKLTEEEKLELVIAQKSIIDAEQKFEVVKTEISKAHDMKKETWMEWCGNSDQC